MRKVNLKTILAATIIFTCIIFYYLDSRKNSKIIQEKYVKYTKLPKELKVVELDVTLKMVKEIKKVKQTSFKINLLNMTRNMVAQEMQEYNFKDSGVNRLEDLLLNEGGRPIRSLIISSWRSGSSFFGELLNSVPGTFYNYEPLMKYKGKPIRGHPHAINSSNVIKQMFKCNFEGLKEFYFDYARRIKKNVDMIKINRRLWDTCAFENELCYDSDFVSRSCKLFPIQSMKTVRYRLPAAKYVLADEELDAKVILLVRDPRAVMHSRANFCINPDCINIAIVCSDLLRDYQAALEFEWKYPHKFMVLRYEDLIQNLNTTVDRLLKFLHLSRTKSVDRFLQTHTTVNNAKKFSTFRISKEVPFKWKKTMKFEEMENIQSICQEAMSKWGYLPAHNSSHMASEEFNPVGKYYFNLDK